MIHICQDCHHSHVSRPNTDLYRELIIGCVGFVQPLVKVLFCSRGSITSIMSDSEDTHAVVVAVGGADAAGTSGTTAAKTAAKVWSVISIKIRTFICWSVRSLEKCMHTLTIVVWSTCEQNSHVHNAGQNICEVARKMHAHAYNSCVVDLRKTCACLACQSG